MSPDQLAPQLHGDPETVVAGDKSRFSELDPGIV
ncbi:MAG: hypothetical protein DDT18_01280 [Actinobacteria bacterium]|nr:hypothetical protein [Actinomycetota bacterium]